MPRRATCGGRGGLWPASPLAHDATLSPWRQHGQPDRRVHRTTQGGQQHKGGLAIQRRSAVARRRPPPPAAARPPPATVKPCGPASSTCRRDGMGNSWLPRVGDQLVSTTTGPWQHRKPGRQCRHATCAQERSRRIQLMACAHSQRQIGDPTCLKGTCRRQYRRYACGA